MKTSVPAALAAITFVATTMIPARADEVSVVSTEAEFAACIMLDELVAGLNRDRVDHDEWIDRNRQSAERRGGRWVDELNARVVRRNTINDMANEYGDIYAANCVARARRSTIENICDTDHDHMSDYLEHSNLCDRFRKNRSE